MQTPMDFLPSCRLAPLGGNVSWRTTEEWEDTKGAVTYSIQTPRKFAIISAKWYKPWRIVAREKSYWAGRVIAECDTKNEARKTLKKVKTLVNQGFEEQVEQKNLAVGDVVSVPTSLGERRHYGVYAKDENPTTKEIEECIYEYQGEATSPVGGQVLQCTGLLTKMACGTTGKIVRTPFKEFEKRVRREFTTFDLRRVKFLQQLSDACERARSKLGKKEFHFLLNNCETFTTWAKTGCGRSAQAAHWIEWVADWAEKGCVAALVFGGFFVFAKMSGLGMMFHLWMIHTLHIGHGPIFAKFMGADLSFFLFDGVSWLVANNNHRVISEGANYEGHEVSRDKQKFQ